MNEETQETNRYEKNGDSHEPDADRILGDMQSQGSNYLIPLGANIKKEADIEFETVDANRILAHLQEANGKGVNMLILDACRDNPFKGFMKSAKSGLTQMDAPTGSLIVYATAPNTAALDDPNGKNSIYTRRLLDALRETPTLNVLEMLIRVRKQVMKDTSDRQVPWEAGSLTDLFYFADAAPTPQPVPTEKPTPQIVYVEVTPTPAPTIYPSDKMNIRQTQDDPEEKNQILKAKNLLLNNKHRDGQTLLKKFINHYPSSTYVEEAYLLLGDSFHKSNRMNDAIQAYEALLGKFPQSAAAPQAQYKIGDAFFRLKRYDDALAAFQKVISNYNDREFAAQAQYSIGSCFKEKQDLNEAVNSYLSVINDYPDVTSVDVQKLSIGVFFQEVKMFDLAMKAYTQVVKVTKDPEVKLEAQYYIGETLYDSGEYPQAILEFFKVTYMGFSPKNIWVATSKFRIAEIYEAQSDWNNALKIYNELYDLFGKSDKRGKTAFDRIKKIQSNQ